MKVLVAGDFAPHARLARQIEEKKFGEIFPEDLCTIIKSVHFSFVNFESSIVENGYKPITKCGPNLFCTPKAVEAIKYAGFTGATMANNHILDFGANGLKRSVECCKNQELDVVGVGVNLKDAEKALYLEKDGKILGVLNCCEHEFSIATDKEAGANPLNPVRLFYAIQEAKKKANYVLIIVHGGHEHYPLPSPRMVETYRFFIDAGADAVVNHHQHCYSGYEIYKTKPIFYGLGNFAFDLAQPKVKSSWNYGFMVELEFGTEILKKIVPYYQYGDEAKVSLLKIGSFDSDLTKINNIIRNREQLQSELSAYYDRVASYELSLLEPYKGRILEKLYSMGLLPSFVQGTKKQSILNHIMCESHRDKLLFAMKKSLLSH